MPRTPGDFGKAFTALLDAAGLTVDQVLRRRPGVATRSTLYDWKKGDHLPADTAPLLAVVELCLDRAGSKGADLGCAPGDADGWLVLLAEAKQSRDSAAISVPGSGTGRDPSRPGRFIGRWDPTELGVHKAIGGGTPPYVHRAHDHLLYALLDPAPAANRLVVLRGGSSTGKSRAAFHAVKARLPHWPVLYPRTAKALARLLDGEQIPPRSVLWLNELRDYAEGPVGQDTLFDLAELLAGRNHIVVLTSLWPDFWKAYTADHCGGPGTTDPVRATRQLLTPLPDLTGACPQDVVPADGGVIEVPDHFTKHDLHAARRCDDPALNQAIGAAEQAGATGQVAQFLAGVPDLMDHYQGPGADPYGHALITAAMDATRLGHTQLLSRELLDHAAAGYLPPQHRALSPQQWSDQHDRGGEYAPRTLKGAIQALQPVPPEHGPGVAGYRLADYLDQHGRTTRADQIPPIAFWTAAAHANPGDVLVLADAARARGLLRDAVRLYVQATERDGCTIDRWRRYSGCAAVNVVRLMGTQCPDDTRPRRWAATHCSLGGPSDVVELLHTTDPDTVTALLARSPASRVAFDHPSLVARLLTRLAELGAHDQIGALLARGPAAQVNATYRYVVDLLAALHRLGAAGQVDILARRAATTVIIRSDHCIPVLTELTAVGAHDHAATLAARAAAELPFTDTIYDGPRDVASLLFTFHAVGATDAIRALLARNPVEHLRDTGSLELKMALSQVGADGQLAALNARRAAMADTGDLHAVVDLLFELSPAGDNDRVSGLLERIPVTRIDLHRPYVLARLLQALTGCGASAYVDALLARNPAAHTSVEDESAVSLLRQLRDLGAHEQHEILAQRIAREFPLQDPVRLRRLFSRLQYIETSVGSCVVKNPIPHLDLLLARDPAGQIDLADTSAVAGLIADLHEHGASDAAARLALRAATDAPLDDPYGVAHLLNVLPPGDLATRLLARDPGTHIPISYDDNHVRHDVTFLAKALRVAGAVAQADHLLRRLVAAGHFTDFLDSLDNGDGPGDFRWGREPNGTPAQPWNWDTIRATIG